MGMIVSMTRVCTISKEENANGKEQVAPSDKSKIYTLRKAVKKSLKIDNLEQNAFMEKQRKKAQTAQSCLHPIHLCPEHACEGCQNIK